MKSDTKTARSTPAAGLPIGNQRIVEHLPGPRSLTGSPERLSVVLRFPVEQDDGCLLLDFTQGSEDALDRLDGDIPLTASLVVLWHGPRCLLVFNRFRLAWELPGGMIDAGESAGQAALRELAEESGQTPDRLDFAGVARVWYAPAGREEYLAIYRGQLKAPAPFKANEEMSDSKWWTPGSELAELNQIDGALAELCRAE